MLQYLLKISLGIKTFCLRNLGTGFLSFAPKSNKLQVIDWKLIL